MKVLTTASTLAVRLHLPVKSLIKSTVYKHFCGGESVQEALKVVEKLDDSQIATVLDYAAEAQQTEEGFEAAARQILQNIQLASSCPGIGAVSIKLTGLGHREILEKLSSSIPLTDQESVSYYHTTRRLGTICQKAGHLRVQLYFDAEESWLQAPIDALAEEMMRRYNRQEVLIFNTLQMYRTDRLGYLENLLAKARTKGFKAGVKLVRGAYWEKERERARKMHYTSPVYPVKYKADANFNKAIMRCLGQLPELQLCLATHNEESLQLVVRELAKNRLQEYRHHLHFSQLYGMSDNLTYALAKAGFNVSKYLPYGEVEKALPYLIRRAEENTAIAGQMGRELQLLKEEMCRRKLA